MPTHAPEPGTADPLGLHGVVPPTITALNHDESVNLEATAAHARFVVNAGVHAVFPLGTNGEFPLLERDERAQVIERVTEEVGSRVPVIAGVGAPGTQETIRSAIHADETGVDGIVVVTPYYYPIGESGFVTHYERVADAVSCPVYIYHIPSKTGNAMSLSTLEKVAAVDGVAGVKDSSKDIPWLGQAIDAYPGLTFLAGSDSLLYPGLSIGCTGMVSAVANVFPELVVDLYDAYDSGDFEQAQSSQSRIYAVRTALKQGPYMTGVKAALSLRNLGFDPGPLRDPLGEMAATDRASLKDDLIELGMLES